MALNFLDIKQVLESHLQDMFDENDILYCTDVDKDEMWNLYLDAIPAIHNPVLYKNREYDCSCCRRFIKELGNVVAIKNGALESLWDITTRSDVWNEVAHKMSEYIKAQSIQSIFIKSERGYGCDFNYDVRTGFPHIRYDHFYAKIPDKFYRKSLVIGSVLSEYNGTRTAFYNSLTAITADAVNTVLDLIVQDSIYRGAEYFKNVKDFSALKQQFDALNTDRERELFSWEHIATAPGPVVKIKNTAIGTLLLDISEGLDLDEAVKKYEVVVAPTNYKRSKPIFTQKMLNDAQRTITELGYLDSLKRRYACAEDISVQDILFINRDTAKVVPGGDDIFAAMSKDVKKSPRKFSRVEEISAEDFVQKVLPTATEVYAYVEWRHTPNFVSLIAPQIKDSKTMFKWNNNFSWAYTGNVTDSVIKQNVKSAGGKVNGVLRFSIQWNDLMEQNNNDEDAHCIEPGGRHIFYGEKFDPKSQGQLDIDITHPMQGVPAVENITWPNLSRMLPGDYEFFVNTYAGRGGRGGFRAEIEYNGEIHQYNYTADTRQGANVNVATVHLSKDGEFTITEHLESSTTSHEIWGVSTNEFIPVNVICYSPNFWSGDGVGNKHYFFMLKDCVNPEMPNAFYNEFLNSELYPAHRKVMEALGSKAHVDEAPNQLSGLGFSSTLRNNLVVKVKSDVERILKVKF